jgi:phosphoenolpyruvate---glycerone phosphotransferase subunit DhaL
MQKDAARLLNVMFSRISSSIAAERDHLTELDGAIGDADHGITMSLGFAAVVSALGKSDVKSLSAADTMRLAASSFLDAVGASTGPLYATAFQSAANVFETNQSLELSEQVAMIEAIASGIRRRGGGQRGDKTMLDAWIPAADAAAAALRQGRNVRDIWSGAVEAGEGGAASTRSMVATRGRAAKLGERSLGHMDPGAASAVLILKAMQQTFTDHEE